MWYNLQSVTNNYLNDSFKGKPTDDFKQNFPYSDAQQGTKLNARANLLLVEDNPNMIEYVHYILSPYYNMQIARTGQEGIDLALTQIPDIIISDVMMPEKTGYELLEVLKQDDRTYHIPIILLSGKTKEIDKLKGLTYGADAYLTKPFNKKELFIRMERLLELRQKLEKKYAITPTKPTVANKSSQGFVEELDSILEKHYKQPEFGVKQLSKLLCISYSQLYRKLKALKQDSPVLYLRNFRLKKAKYILEQNSNLYVFEVAYLVGFKDPNYFSRIFSDAFGYAPTKGRK